MKNNRKFNKLMIIALVAIAAFAFFPVTSFAKNDAGAEHNNSHGQGDTTHSDPNGNAFGHNGHGDNGGGDDEGGDNGNHNGHGNGHHGNGHGCTTCTGATGPQGPQGDPGTPADMTQVNHNTEMVYYLNEQVTNNTFVNNQQDEHLARIDQDLAGVHNSIADLYLGMYELSNKVNAAAATGIAAASLMWDPSYKGLQGSFGYGNYGGESAMTFGLGKVMGDKTAFNVNATFDTQGGHGFGAGINVKF